MDKALKKSRDECEITVSIPKKLVIEYANDRICPFQPKPYYQRVIDSIVRKALLNYYFEMFRGGDVDDSRG
jgi:hypothetical protein